MTELGAHGEDLVNKLLLVNPRHRISLADAAEHPFCKHTPDTLL